MASTKEITCACGCNRKKMVRVADIKRGWGRFFSKKCAAKGNCRKAKLPGSWLDSERDYGSGAQSGQFGHGQD